MAVHEPSQAEQVRRNSPGTKRRLPLAPMDFSANVGGQTSCYTLRVVARRLSRVPTDN
jgi:hypothetical protein